MKIVHGTWIPHTETDFIQSGSFYLWVETPVPKSNRNHKQQIHPGHLAKGELINFLVQELGIKEPAPQLSQCISAKYFALPTADNQPLPSPELIKYLEIEIPEEYTEFQYWQVDCYQTLTSVKNNTPAINIIRLLNDIHFLAINNLSDIQLGSDLLFWYHYTQSFKQTILKDQYIPTLKYRQLETPPPKGKTKKPIPPAFEIYAGWSIISEQHEENIQKYIEYMPLICVAGSNGENENIEFFDEETLLRHFSESILHNIVTHTPSTAAFDKQITDSLVYYCFSQQHNPRTANITLEEYKQWQTWKSKITRSQSELPFYLCFQLNSPAAEQIDNWEMQFLVSSKQDPSLKLPLADYWSMKEGTGDWGLGTGEDGENNRYPMTNVQSSIKSLFGKDFETNLLLNLG